MKLTAQDLYRFGVIDNIIPEPVGGAHNDFEYVTGKVKEAISADLKELMSFSLDEMLERRYLKFRII